MEEKKTTKKTTKTETEVKEAVSKVDDTVAENAALKAQLEEMKAQIELMAKMMSNNAVPAPTKRSKKQITFISLVTGVLVMKGTRVWTISGQFNSVTVSEEEAEAIVNNSNNLVRSGCVYITDAEFIEEHHLSDSYNFILSDEQLKSILTVDYTKCVEMYKATSDEQKQIIADMIALKCMNGEEVDANIVKQIGKLSGRKFDDLEPDGED